MDKWAIVLSSAVASPAHTTASVSQRLPGPISTLSPALITPLSAPNQANTSGEFKPLTSQKFLCNNRLGFWRFNSIHSGRPSGVMRVWGGVEGRGAAKGRRTLGPPSSVACHLPWQGPWGCSSPSLSPQGPDSRLPSASLWEDTVGSAWPTPTLPLPLPSSSPSQAAASGQF